MQEITLTINNGVGLHARPASLFVQTTRRFAADVTLIQDGQEVNAKSILSVLTLGVGPGSEVTIRAQGDDEALALAALRDLAASNFGDDAVAPAGAVRGDA